MAAVPNGAHELQGRDGRMVAIMRGKHGVEDAKEEDPREELAALLWAIAAESLDPTGQQALKIRSRR